MLSAGQRCILYADRDLPTSNKIYQAIGYAEVGSAREWMFDPAG